MRYDQQQIIFALNSIANAPSGRHGSVSELEAYAGEVVRRVLADPGVVGLIGEWKLVWGPAVFQADGSTVADNAMYVAQNQTDESEYVVAISGTNPISAYGWIVEDFTLVPTVAWPFGDAGSSAGDITQGTSVGLNNLLNDLSSGNQTLLPFLADQVAGAAAPLKITVTGHSLGGALSPATALALRDTQGIPLGQPDGWDPQSSSTIAVLPSAGPTPGNVTWRNYYDERLGYVTNRLWNAIDVVPHAWQISMLEQVPGLYEPTIEPTFVIRALVGLAIANSLRAGDLQQIRPDVPGLPGEVNPDITISVRNMLVLLETMIANNIIDKLAKDLPADVLAALKSVVDELIRHLNGQADLEAKVDVSSMLSMAHAHTETEPLLEELARNSIIDFLNFLFQMAYQHTTAYSELLGTTGFDAIYEAIKTQIG